MQRSKGFRLYQLPGISVIGSAALCVAGCSHRPESTPSPKSSAGRAPCEALVPAPAVTPESLRIVITDALRSEDAPTPHSNAEQLIFPLLYGAKRSAPCSNAESSVSVAGDGSTESAGRNTGPVEIRSAYPTIPWPAPTGLYGIADATDTTLDLLPRTSRAEPHIHVNMVAPRQGRDALDAGADVVVTSDAKTIAYAAAQSDLASVPLSWDKVYVLIEPGVRVGGDRDSMLAVQTDLAKYALRVEARPADDSATLELITCPTIGPDNSPSGTTPRQPSTTSTHRVVYERDDDVARALSERLVALAGAHTLRLAAFEDNSSSGRSIRAAGLDTASFRVALGDGSAAAYVIALPLDPLVGCDAVGWLRLDALWLFARDDSPTNHLTPLVETRARAIVRRGRVGLSGDSAGTASLIFGAPAGF